MKSDAGQAVRIDGIPVEALESFLRPCRYLPLTHCPTANTSRAAATQAQFLIEAAAGQDAVMFGVRRRGALRGMALIVPLPWDSEQLNMPMGRIHALHLLPDEPPATAAALVAAAQSEARARGWRFLDLQPHARDLSVVNGAMQRGFQLVASTIGLCWELSLPLPEPPKTSAFLRAASIDEAVAVGEMASQAIDPDSRFAIDPLLPPGAAPAVFASWAANSVRGYADHTCIALLDDVIAGYCTWRENPRSDGVLGGRLVNLDLTAVSPGARGAHVLSAMMHEGLANYQCKGFRAAEVVTHVLNASMQRAAHRFGALALTAHHRLHWHAPEAIDK